MCGETTIYEFFAHTTMSTTHMRYGRHQNHKSAANLSWSTCLTQFAMYVRDNNVNGHKPAIF